ncbi:MAG: toll/interleukin-1 receptor domain-containing protein [Actinomycetota bacterium]|nr:toll/interleukin-1 receptor domain-containing protein [Actinomycetota bacterium]
MLFASYTRADRDLIATLLTDLRALGHVVWLDQELSGGQVWWDEILAKIRQCEALLFLVSPSSVESEACLLELEYAISLNRVVIPVQLVQTDPNSMPSVLETHQTVSYQHGDKAETMALARALTQTEVDRPLPDPLPAEPPLPGSYFGSIRDQIKSRDPMSLDQQLGLLHRLRARADDGARDDVVTLLNSLRSRDDLFASVATQIDALQTSLVPPPAPSDVPRHAGFRGRFRRPDALIDQLAIALIAVAIVAALFAMSSDLWEVETNGPTAWGDVDLQRWHLGVLLCLFVVSAGLSFSKTQIVRRVASPAAVGVSLIGLFAWWWLGGIVGGLLLENYVATDSADVKLAFGMTGSGFSLATQVLAGVLLSVSAFSSGQESAAKR